MSRPRGQRIYTELGLILFSWLVLSVNTNGIASWHCKHCRSLAFLNYYNNYNSFCRFLFYFMVFIVYECLTTLYNYHYTTGCPHKNCASKNCSFWIWKTLKIVKYLRLYESPKFTLSKTFWSITIAFCNLEICPLSYKLVKSVLCHFLYLWLKMPPSRPLMETL